MVPEVRAELKMGHENPSGNPSLLVTCCGYGKGFEIEKSMENLLVDLKAMGLWKDFERLLSTIVRMTTVELEAPDAEVSMRPGNLRVAVNGRTEQIDLRAGFALDSNTLELLDTVAKRSAKLSFAARAYRD